MHFGLSEEQAALRDAARRQLAAEAPMEANRRWMEAGRPDRALWSRLAAEQGWAALAVPEALGGLGLGAVELAVLQEELGRALVPSPFFGTVCLAIPTLVALAAPEQAARWLGPLLSGDETATLAWTGCPRASRLGGGTCVDGPGGPRLSGRWEGVVDAGQVDRYFVLTHGDTSAMYHVQAAAPGVRVEAPPTMDTARTLGTLILENVEAEPLPGRDVAPVLYQAATTLAAEQLGVAERCLEMAVDYAKVRRQFGRPIGSFQAIKHLCADLLVLVESARSATWYAAWTADHAPAELPLAAAMARIAASEAAFRCAADNLQVHGGIGFTWEHDAHLYLKRARSAGALLGDVAGWREHVAHRLGW